MLNARKGIAGRGNRSVCPHVHARRVLWKACTPCEAPRLLAAMPLGPALRGAASLQRSRFLPSSGGCLAHFPWARLLDAAEDAQRRFANINSPAYEDAYDDVVAAHGLGPVGPA